MTARRLSYDGIVTPSNLGDSTGAERGHRHDRVVRDRQRSSAQSVQLTDSCASATLQHDGSHFESAFAFTCSDIPLQ